MLRAFLLICCSMVGGCASLDSAREQCVGDERAWRLTAAPPNAEHYRQAATAVEQGDWSSTFEKWYALPSGEIIWCRLTSYRGSSVSYEFAADGTLTDGQSWIVVH